MLCQLHQSEVSNDNDDGGTDHLVPEKLMNATKQYRRAPGQVSILAFPAYVAG
jgi:hypothetical protein